MQRTCGDRGSQECSVNRGDQRGHKMSGRWNVGPATWHAESYETGAMEVVGGAGGGHIWFWKLDQSQPCANQVP